MRGSFQSRDRERHPPWAPPAKGIAAFSATFLGSRLDDTVLRDNFFGSLTVPVFVYADWGLVKLESNTVRDSSNGFIFLTPPLLAATFNMANVTVDPAYVMPAVHLHNALFNTLANPSFQIASAALRGFSLPPNFDLTKAQTFTPGAAAATDISRIQDLFDRVLPSAAAPPVPPAPETEHARRAAPARVALSDNPLALRQHPLASIVPVPASVVSLNQNISLIENQAAAQAATQNIPAALHIVNDDVNAQIPGPFSNAGLVVASVDQDPRDAINLAGNTFIATSSDAKFPIDFVAGVLRASITGNIILNEFNVIEGDFWSLFVLATQGAITGNVLLGQPFLYVPPPPLNYWNAFNSISAT
jgi:hypothetical protein